MSWNPFPGKPDDMVDKNLTCVRLYNGTEGVFQVLRWRQVLKSLQIEVMDTNQNQARAHAYHAAKVFYSKHQ